MPTRKHHRLKLRAPAKMRTIDPKFLMSKLAPASGVAMVTLAACANSQVPQSIVDSVWAISELLDEARAHIDSLSQVAGL